MPAKRHKRREESATPDLTPMIDVTFQLLIFFILCTRFRTEEKFFETHLPDKEGLETKTGVPTEKLTIYCQWDAKSQSNTYVVAIDARGRKPVEGSFAQLNELVIYPSDSDTAIAQKRARYRAVHKALVDTLEAYRERSGADVEGFEISFAVKAADGARSGTAPWLFVTLAIDATSSINRERAKQGREALPVTFKYADALGVYAR